jgi:endonuclease YncB( thermonuclease family)
MRHATPVLTLTLGVMIGAGGMWWWMVQPKTYTGPATLIDGDTIKIRGRRISFVGINAPELPDKPTKCRRHLSQPYCTEPAAAALHERINSKIVTCTEVGRDRFSRTLDMCWHGSTALNVWLLEQCLAHSPRNPRHRDKQHETIIAQRTCSRS